ncbi:protein jag [Propioniciclava sp. MC1683]|nr:protein jag [Propioniciclava sp. MC1683]
MSEDLDTTVAVEEEAPVAEAVEFVGEPVTDEVEAPVVAEGDDAPVESSEDSAASPASADEVDEADTDEDASEAGEAAAPRMSKREEALTNEGEIAADYLEELLDIADLDGDIDTFNEGGRAHVSIITDSDALVGKDGEVLDALQELARLAVMTETGHRSRLMLDVAGYRDKQRSMLQDLAADAISDVQESGEPVRLTPMNPYQRKIVHDAVAAAGLVSESEGEEPNRRVVVLPKA